MERNSSFELLRIGSILLITIHHVLVYGLGACNYDVGVSYCGTNTYIEDVINSLCIVGVNVFILISGWFGIKSIRRSLYRILYFYLLCAFLIFIERRNIDLQVFSFDTWWFVPHFVILVLLSPMIESSVQQIPKNRFVAFVILLLVVNIVLGYLGRFIGVYINENGYNFQNFVCLYYIARYCKIYQNDLIVSKMKKYGLVLWVLCSVLWGVIHAVRIEQGHDYGSSYYWGYNNPIVLLSSVFLFLCCTQFEFKSRFVNNVSSVSFLVYLFSTKEFFQFKVGEIGAHVFASFSYLGVILYCVVLVMLFYVLFYIIHYAINRIANATSLLFNK